MKPAKFWQTHWTGCELSEKQIQSIQLDAAKWGAEQAAEVAYTKAKQFRQTGDGTADVVASAVSSFANNLTIDQLPR